MNRVAALIALALALAGCDEAASPLVADATVRADAAGGDIDHGAADMAPDVIAPPLDMASVDMAPADMASPADLAPPADMARPEDMAPPADMAPPEDMAPAPDMAVEPDAGPLTAAACFDGLFSGELTAGPDYDQFGPIIGSHCMGTDHQRIERVERVVFVGDSVTVGTPPHDPAVYYRNVLAARLAARFGLTAPDFLWQQVNLIDGVGLVQESGDFAHCAKYGARTDDLLRDRTLLSDCVPEDKRHLRTLFVMTIGGNDVASITQDGLEPDADPAELWAETEEFVGLLRDAMRWIRAPGRFPNGAWVVYANMFEFTDGTGDITACPAAGLAGFGAEWDDPTLLADMVVWANEQFLAIALEYGVDMVFMLEHFCGHGFNYDDPMSPCYRGPGTELWFDITCIHPNAAGHRAIADLFEAVVAE